MTFDLWFQWGAQRDGPDACLKSCPGFNKKNALATGPDTGRAKPLGRARPTLDLPSLDAVDEPGRTGRMAISLIFRG
ncbi:hypothetical protein [Dyadobacter fermentans]|uniref:hypothetical protein n=1 Tax=Dyadobacter fermentans TaxID=94254 RepID=UPI001CC0518E|nr:hypothetical protein [Dyadobacter fermentans]MBZ1361522.1 hypothetical protein [Dyadobacter fermentans]